MCDHCMNRREFAAMTTAGLAGGVLGLVRRCWRPRRPSVEPWDPDKPPVVTGRPLRVQPILAHNVMAPREKTSWRSWSDIINEPAAAEEMQRIAAELEGSRAKADFPLEILPTAKVTTAEQAANLQKGDFDVVLAVRRLERGAVPPVLRGRPEARHGGLRPARVGPDLLRLRVSGHPLLSGPVARTLAAQHAPTTTAA